MGGKIDDRNYQFYKFIFARSSNVCNSTSIHVFARRIGVIVRERPSSPPLLSFSCLYQYISIFRCRRIAVLSRSWRYFICRYVKRAIKELVGLVPNFDIVHAQQIAMFSYLTGSLRLRAFESYLYSRTHYAFRTMEYIACQLPCRVLL